MTEGDSQYRIEWATPARRGISTLPDKVAVAIIEFVYGALADNPERVGRPLRWELEGLHAARRGDYRVVYRIDPDRGVVVIEALVHRSDIYRRRWLVTASARGRRKLVTVAPRIGASGGAGGGSGGRR